MAFVVRRYEALFTLISQFSRALPSRNMTSSGKQTFISPYNKGHKCIIFHGFKYQSYRVTWGRSGHDRMVVGFMTTYAISAHHHWWCEFESRSGRGEQHYVIKFVSDLRQVGGFLRVLRFPPPIKLTVKHQQTYRATALVFTFLLLYLHMYYSHWNVFYKQQYSMVTPVIQSYSPCFTFLFFLLAHLTQRVIWAVVTTERPSSVRPSINFSHFNQLLWSHWANLNQTLVEWSLDGPLPKLCPVFLTSNQDGRQAKNRKKGDEILIVHCCFSISQNELKCSYMARSSLTYIPCYSVKFFFQPIYTDYAN
jgi:hypothetical protein